MKSTEYIEWDKLEQIPFCLCRIAEDEENQEIDVYYLDKRVCHDYDHVGHYFRTAIIMFRRRFADSFVTLPCKINKHITQWNHLYTVIHFVLRYR